MISMVEFEQIVKLRNEGKSQREIAELLGISRRSVGRYLKSGKVPKYERATKSNKIDPFVGFETIAEEKLAQVPGLLLSELYEYLLSKGYAGSQRTIQRKTAELRRRLKRKEVYFTRSVTPGVIMEGDFTEMKFEIAGVEQKIYLWVTTLPFSNSFYATPFFNCTFECFAEGSVKGFEAFGGVAEYYRLDNLSPAVSQILRGKDRVVTQRYKEFQDHYGFKQDFCNPAKGNEKGNVESNIRHIKSRLRSRIALQQVKFSSLESLQHYIAAFCDEHNQQTKVSTRFSQESLAPLPATSFRPFRTTMAKVNKFSLVTLEKTGHSYSVPSDLLGLTLEVRIYSSTIDILDRGEVVVSHKRLRGPSGMTSVRLEHIIDELCRKPGAMKDWEHRHILFERPVWSRFYEKLKTQGSEDKDYLRCLKLMSIHGREVVTLAMELALEGETKLDAPGLENLVSMKLDKIYEMKPVDVDLGTYDEFLEGVSDGCKSSSES